MPKIQKNETLTVNKVYTKQDRENVASQLEFEKQFMIISALKSYVVLIGVLVISLLFNLEIIGKISEDSSTTYKILISTVKIALIMIYFFLGVVVIGNLLELKGKVLDWKGLLILYVSAILQGILSSTVFFLSVLGIFLVCVYFYFMQGRVSDRLDFDELANRL